ncbi:hypothetical protein ACRWOO_11445 [Streptomyces sp. NEAU-PBA10]|nr:hypothetical protein [Streptomyces sp. T7(2022)]MCG5121572.1 hypothetical protein [Streptomyces sp. T7(2022)]
MTTDRTAIALIGAMLAGLIAVTQPTIIPALGVSIAAGAGLIAYLRA